MKNVLFTLTLLLFSSISLVGQKTIAVQSGNQLTTYTTIDEAIAGASAGDIIYLPGGIFPGFNLDKKLTIIGAGHKPSSTGATGMTMITGSIAFANSECDGSVISGLRIQSGIFDNGNPNDSIQVSRCFMESAFVLSTESQNWIISENFVNQIQSPTNALISNNIINKIYDANFCSIYNNIFLHNSYLAIEGDNCTIKNNIFKYFLNYSPFNSVEFLANSEVYNNIYSDGELPNSIFGHGNTGVANIKDTDFDGLFELFSYASYYNQNSSNLYQFDFHLVNPSYNTVGTDGKPISIFGGIFPWKEGSIPSNPHILSKSIGNQTDQNGNLLINIQVEAQDH